MTFIKESFVPALIILAAAALVVLASLPLAQTDWAEGIRSGFGHEGTEQMAEAEGGEGERDMGAFVYVAVLLKVTVLMGIGGLLAALALGGIKLASKTKRAVQGSG